ncbi:hypothetical protein ACOAOT_23895 [Lacrimispora sp. AGF001]|uniref:hypothetical protein n=1 Tax=Lacrimispora sp. AGF001 TaxID=3401631 RepID=UPI003B42D88E
MKTQTINVSSIESEETVAMAKMVAEDTAATVTEVNKKIYIGPTFKGVVNGTVFKGDLPPMLQTAIKDLPAIGELVIPLADLIKANKELSIPKSSLNRFFEMAKKYGRGE